MERMLKILLQNMKTSISPRWRLAATALVLFASLRVCTAQSLVWEVERQWDATWEDRYSEFIAAMGECKATSLAKCIDSPANPYRGMTPPELRKNLFADCADLPYVLRAYFAFINKLPFSYTQEVEAVGSTNDIRYSPRGNRPGRRRTISAVDKADVLAVLRDVRSQISSAQFRMSSQLDVTATTFPDFYPTAINRQSIRPGTNVYDPNGHVAIVYEVEKNGVIHLMDAHPDNSISRIVYGKKFVRSGAAVGAGFKNWRPHVNGAALRNQAVPHFSLVQHFGTEPGVADWKIAAFHIKGEARDYYEYVRESMAEGTLEYEPLQEFTSMLENLSMDIVDRANAVEVAIKAGIDQRPHPARLPANIYGTEGDWETYSTPSRDARLKVAFKEAHDAVENFLTMARVKDRRLKFQGSSEELKERLRQIYEEHAAKPILQYQASHAATKNVQLTFGQVEERLFRLSFDPYHCIELRWGALETCEHDLINKAWYRAEQRLRNQTDRSYEVIMNFSLDDLNARGPGTGKDTPPVYRLSEILGDGPV